MYLKFSGVCRIENVLCCLMFIIEVCFKKMSEEQGKIVVHMLMKRQVEERVCSLWVASFLGKMF